MRFKLTFVLLLANLAVFFVLWRLNQPPEIVARPAGAIPKENFDIDHIIINDHAHNEVRELKRDRNNVWHLVKPVDWLANGDAIADLINHLELLDEKTNFSIDDAKKSGESLKTYGLDNPAVEITVGSGTQTAKLDIGTALGTYLYVRNPADGLVRVVPQELLSALDKPLDELRDKRLFTLELYAVQSLSISTTGTGAAPATSFTHFVYDGDQWKLDTPFSCAADRELVNKVINHLISLRAVSFVAAADAGGDLARYGLTTPFLKVALKDDTADPSQELWLGSVVPGATEKEYYAKLADNPTVLVVKDDPLFATLLHAQDSLRERQFLDFSPEKVSTISVHSAVPADLQMEMLENQKWQIVGKDAAGAPAYIAADAGIIKTMLDSLTQLSAKNFVSDAPTSDDLQNTFNLKSPQWKVVLQGDKTFKPITLDIGISTATTPVHYYAKIEGADSVYEIDSEIIAQFSTDALHYRDRTLETLPAGAQIVSFKLTHLTGDDLAAGEVVFDFSIDPAKTNWGEFLKDKPQLIRDNVQVMLDSMKQFVVEDYKEAKFDEHFQTDLAETANGPMETAVPWRYRLDVGVQLAGAGGAAATKETLTFYFSDRFGGRRFGGTREPPMPPAVFTLPIKSSGALGSITADQAQPPAAVQTLRELDQPINPATTVPAASPGPATATPSAAPIAPLDIAIPAPAPLPAAPSVVPAP